MYRILPIALLILAMQGAYALAQPMSYSETKSTLDRIKYNSDAFKDMFKDDLERDDVNSQVRHQMKDAADRFEDIAEKAKNRYGKHNAAVPQVRTLLQEGSLIDAFISEHAMSPAVENQWRMMRADLDRLAVNYNLTAEWRSSLARTEPDENSSQLNRRQMEDLIREIQTSADLYQANANAAIQNASVSPSWISTFDGLMREFRLSVDRLQSGFQSGQSTVSLANTAIRNAETLDIFMRDHPLSSSASESWEQVRTDLSRLALAYHIDSPWLAAYR